MYVYIHMYVYGEIQLRTVFAVEYLTLLVQLIKSLHILVSHFYGNLMLSSVFN